MGRTTVAVCLLLALAALAFAQTPYEGYNLFRSLQSTTAYLMDNDGVFVHSWDAGYLPGNGMYLLENGELFHAGKINNPDFDAPGAGGIVQTFDWDGSVTWEYEYSSTEHLQHHDVEMLPNGNVLMVAWQYKSEAEAIAAGRDPSLLDAGELWPDSIIEVMPTGSNTGDIVWEWHVWDHLVQDYDPTKPDYGVIADHPELIDLNCVDTFGGTSWNNVNSVDYNAELDQIILSVRMFGEIWVIDHSTTAAEAAGHSGGSSSMGGDLLYRWGNPQNYDAGTSADQRLFYQHDAEWIEAGLPGEGNILIFNNGQGRPGGNYSSVDEIVPPVNPDGSYTLTPGSAYGPTEPLWIYTADPPDDFYSAAISGTQRLPNGNTLICEGNSAHFFEVTASGETVWEYDYTGMVFRVERYAPDYPGLWQMTGVEPQAAPASGLFSLGQNRPNPFDLSTVLSFTAMSESRVNIKVVDVSGRVVSVLADARYPAGEFHVEWDGCDDNGAEVASGIYFALMEADGLNASRKLILLR